MALYCISWFHIDTYDTGYLSCLLAIRISSENVYLALAHFWLVIYFSIESAVSQFGIFLRLLFVNISFIIIFILPGFSLFIAPTFQRQYRDLIAIYVWEVLFHALFLYF